MRYIIRILLFIYTGIAFLPASRYFKELLVSFEPYWIPVLILCIMWSLVSLYPRQTKSDRYLLWIQICYSFGLVLTVLIPRYATYYGSYPRADQTTSWQISIFYANVLYTNDDLTNLKHLIKQQNPDVIMMIECTKQTYQQLASWLLEQYPHSNREILNQDLVGSVVFSKLPIKNIPFTNIPKKNRRYSYFVIDPEGKHISTYLIHTSSPIADRYFQLRNQQINYLWNRIQDSDEKADLILGDFNVTPRSHWYQQFEQQLWSWFFNITRTFWPLFTRRQLPLIFIRAHIDHIWINTDTTTYSKLQKIDIPGSDHDGFMMYLKK
jgi:endonuclease/exonuclease/phosphatase (EEP) superfamily protein YafD